MEYTPLWGYLGGIIYSSIHLENQLVLKTIPMHGIYTPMGLEVTIAKIINLEFKPLRGYK